MTNTGPVHAVVSAEGGLYLACTNARAKHPDTISTGGPVTCDDCLVWLELNERGPAPVREQEIE